MKVTIWNSALKRYIRKYYFVTGMIFFTIIKFFLTDQLPVAMILDSYHDDLLMVRMGNSILNGNWLGPYHSNTLVKGVMYPLFLAVSNKIGLTSNQSQSLLYIAACMIFYIAVRPVVNKKYMLLLLYVILLFNPASMNISSFQRVYRCSITPAQVLLVFGSFWGLYFSVCKKGRIGIGWSFLAGCSLFFFWNTREDSIWILPFVCVVTIISISVLLYKKIKLEKTEKWNFVRRIFSLLLPILLLKSGNLFLSYQNYIYYGIFTVNELNDSNFSEAMKKLYAVKSKESMQWVSVTREKMRRIYEVSPSLYSIKEILESRMDDWDHLDRTPGDHEVENGWFFWALRDAVQQAGYYQSAKTADDFYKNVADEIQSALDSGALEAQKIMPSALMPPWNAAYWKEYLNAVKESVLYLFHFVDTNAQYWVSEICSREDYDNYMEYNRLIKSPKSISINTNINITYSDEDHIFFEREVGRVNRIAGCYQNYNFIISIAAGFCYLYLLVYVCKIGRFQQGIWDLFLVLSSLSASLFVLIIGVSYNHTFSCDSIRSLYYSGAYSLILPFEVLSLCFGGNAVLKFIRKKGERQVAIHGHDSSFDSVL